MNTPMLPSTYTRFTAAGGGTRVTGDTAEQAAGFFRSFIGREPDSVTSFVVAPTKAKVSGAKAGSATPERRPVYGLHDDEIRKAARTGLMMTEIASAGGVSRTFVRNAMQRLGVYEEWQAVVERRKGPTPRADR